VIKTIYNNIMNRIMLKRYYSKGIWYCEDCGVLSKINNEYCLCDKCYKNSELVKEIERYKNTSWSDFIDR
jgi:hypothetical protein